jgi:hypothetical protein
MLAMLFYMGATAWANAEDVCPCFDAEHIYGICFNADAQDLDYTRSRLTCVGPDLQLYTFDVLRRESNGCGVYMDGTSQNQDVESDPVDYRDYAKRRAKDTKGGYRQSYSACSNELAEASLLLGIPAPE